MGIRNLAIIAHVDHGKTTLVDHLLKQSGTMEDIDSKDCVMDQNDQEKERGITIYAKNTSIEYKDNIINIVDTPGHADFGSEVERVLKMVDSVLLVVDASEGPMPQTRFVVKKSLELGLEPILIINKMDKPTANPDKTIDQVFDMFIELGANDEQLDFPVVYSVGIDGTAVYEPEDEHKDITPLFETILEYVPVAKDFSDKPLKMQIVNLDYSDFIGRLGIGRIYQGSIKQGQQVIIIDNEGEKRKGKVTSIFVKRGLQRIETDKGECGDIVTIAGLPDIYVGDTVCENKDQESMSSISIDEPTLTMEFMPNNSPFAGQDGEFVTSRNIRERLEKELEVNVGLQVDFSRNPIFTVSGRGELHLSVLIETMRREGFELQVSAPEVIMKEKDGKKLEPIEKLIVNVKDNVAGDIIEYISKRKGLMQHMFSENGITNIKFEVPTRGLLGFRSWFIEKTKGEGIASSSFLRYEKYRGDIQQRKAGSLISKENGKAMTYSIWKLQDRGPIFIQPGTKIYEGMIVGENLKGNDLVVNMTKNKQLNNFRESGNDEDMDLDNINEMSLEDALSYVKSDEYVEITPKTFRLRKKHLTESERKRNS